MTTLVKCPQEIEIITPLWHSASLGPRQVLGQHKYFWPAQDLCTAYHAPQSELPIRLGQLARE